jgi:hypothetical protein
VISSNTNIGIYSHLSAPAIYDSTILSNGNIGLYFDSSNPIINHNNIYNNTAYGIYNAKPSTVINATNNYWGSVSGPSGSGPGTGDKATDGVLYNPWVTERLNLRGPVCKITSPASEAILNGIIEIRGEASDIDSEIVYVEIKIDNNTWQRATGTLSWNFSVDTTKYTDGEHSVYARAWDGRYYSNVVCLKVNVDNPPIVTIIEEDQTVKEAYFTINWTTDAADIQYYEIKINNENWVNVENKTSYTFTLAEGKNTLYVRGIDKGNNTGIADAVIITYEKVGYAVFPKHALIVIIVLTAIVCLCILLLKRHKK